MRTTRVVLTALAAVACSGPSEPEARRVLGAIAGLNAGDPHVEVPATAERGVQFPVSVWTYGDGCYRAGDTEVRVAGPSTVEVAPYDFTRLGIACEAILKGSMHAAMVRFDAAGPARVRVRGRHGLDDTELSVERDLLVR